MALTEVYSSTTAPNPKAACCLVPSDHLDLVRFLLKVAQVVLSFVAFVLEECVLSCISCTALYFFEFVSCTAFFFTLLLLVLLASTLHLRVGIACWPQLDFVYTCVIALLLFISSIVFASSNTGSSLEKAAVAFGFLSCLAFLGDVGVFVQSRGFPFLRGGGGGGGGGGAPDSSNGVPVTVEAPAETEKLNTAVNDN